MQLEDYHKLAQDYIRAGVRGADLIQRVMNSSNWNWARAQEFLIEHYPSDVEEVIRSINNAIKTNTKSPGPCPECGKPLGEGVTRCWTDGCDYVLP